MDFVKNRKDSDTLDDVFSNRDLPKIAIIPFNSDNLVKHPSRKVSQRAFINTVNHIHFVEGQLFAHMSTRSDNKEFLVRVSPEPCQGPEISCRLPEGFSYDPDNLELKHLIIDDGKSISLMKIEPLNISNFKFAVKIQGKGCVFSKRYGRRFRCLMVNAVLIQESKESYGVLEDFNPSGLRIVLEKNAALFDPRKNITIKLYTNEQTIFSGSCRYVRNEDESRSIIVRPIDMDRPIFKNRKNRNPRLNLKPSPKIFFIHPLSNRNVTYDIGDITTSGFSVYEDAQESLLFPGMIIPEVTILSRGSLKIRCSAQVVHSRRSRMGKVVKHGFSILDMNMKDFGRLFDIVSNAYDPHANMSADINMDDLWEFFFSSGFIYPKKYIHLSKIKEEFKETYRRLYQEGQEIFTNFTYQKNGKIYGHNCTIRSYQNAWMIHHLAALSTGARRIGLDVVKHSHFYFDGMYRLPSIGMDYMIMYFRPDNKFPNYFFGGFCRDYKNQQACSMDLFAYIVCETQPGDIMLPDGWSIHECSDTELDDFRAIYKKLSGGLMIDAFGIPQKTSLEEESIENMYGKIGLKRKSSVYKLEHYNTCRAYWIIDESDAGVNLSELLNSIKVVVTDVEGLPWKILQNVVSSFRGVYGSETIQLLVLPNTYMNYWDVSYEKEYFLWVLNTQYGDEYVEYIKQKLKFSFMKYVIKLAKSKLVGQ